MKNNYLMENNCSYSLCKRQGGYVVSEKLVTFYGIELWGVFIGVMVKCK